jgi:hypothetical protein
MGTPIYPHILLGSSQISAPSEDFGEARPERLRCRE